MEITMEERQLIKKKERAKPETMAKTCEKLGEYYMAHNRFDQALEQFKDETKYLQTSMSIAMNNRKQGEIYIMLKDYPNALQHISAYLKWAKENDNKIEIQRAYATLGRFYIVRAEATKGNEETQKLLKDAERASLKSLSVCNLLKTLPKSDLADMEGRLYLNLGLIKEFQENYDQCVSYLEKAKNLFQKNHLLDLYQQCLMNLALFYNSKLNDTRKAFQYLDQAMNIVEKLPQNEEKLCDIILLKSKIFIKAGNFRSAKKILYRAYKLKSPDSNQIDEIECRLKTVAAMCYAEDSLLKTDELAYAKKRELHEKLGDGACTLNNFSKGIHYYLLALKYAGLAGDPNLTPLYVSLYETYKDNKQYDLALEYMQKELELNKSNPPEACLTLKNIGTVYELLGKDFWETDSMYQKAREEATKAQDKHLEQTIFLKQLKLRQKHGMEMLADILKNEAQMADIDLTMPESQAESEDVNEVEPKNVTDIGDDICLDDLTDDEVDEEVPTTSTDARHLRRRGTSFKIKRNEKGETQLHQACISGNFAKAKQLIDVGHPVNVSDNAGWTPLHEACNHEHPDIVELLLEHGANVDDHGGSLCDGLTPLHSACMAGSLNVIDAMLDAGAKVTALDNAGDTPLRTLEKWKMREKLDPEAYLFYQSIRKRMIGILERAGVIDQISSDSADYYTPDQTIAMSTPTTATTTTTESSIKSTTSSSASDSENEAEITVRPNPFRNPDLSDSSDEEAEAANDYRNTINSLRPGNRTSAEERSPSKTPKKRAAVLTGDDVGEDWLEHDMPDAKKRKKAVATPRSARKRILISSDSDEPHCSRRIEPRNLNIVIDEDSDSSDAFSVLMNQPSTSAAALRTVKRTKSQLKLGTNYAKRHKTLLESGFYRSTSPSGVESHGEAMVTSSQDTELPLNPTIQSPPQTVAASNLSFVKVEVEEQKLIVPIKTKTLDDLTISWLAKEAGRRYYNLKGLEPILRLTTEDGAIFEDTDPLRVVLTGSMVCSTVLDWTLPSIAQRYMEACSSLKIAPDANVQELLGLIQATQALSITNSLLDVATSKPLFKALQHQTNLTVLDLSNNFLTNDGLRNLAQSLSTLKQLKSLNLSGNLISSEGLQHLADIFPTSNLCLTELKSLDLSFNPIQNQGLVYLSKFCANLKNLSTLNLCSTDLTDFTFTDCYLNRLIDFDLSFNQFKLKNLIKCLKELNSCKLIRLNIGFSTMESGIAECLSTLLHSGTCENLQELNLSGLHLSDGDVWQILQSIPQSKLQILHLDDNPELSSISLKLLLERLSVDHLYLNGCGKMLKNFNLNTASPLEITAAQDYCKHLSITVNPSEQNDMQHLFRRMMGTNRHCRFNVNCSVANIYITDAM